MRYSAEIGSPRSILKALVIFVAVGMIFERFITQELSQASDRPALRHQTELEKAVQTLSTSSFYIRYFAPFLCRVAGCKHGNESQAPYSSQLFPHLKPEVVLKIIVLVRKELVLQAWAPHSGQVFFGDEDIAATTDNCSSTTRAFGAAPSGRAWRCRSRAWLRPIPRSTRR